MPAGSGRPIRNRHPEPPKESAMTGPFPARHVFLPALVLAAGLALPAPARAAANPGDDARNKGAEETVKDEAKTDDKKAVWSELDSKSNVNSYRRNLQRKHLTTLVNLAVQSDPAQPAAAGLEALGARPGTGPAGTRALYREALPE